MYVNTFTALANERMTLLARKHSKTGLSAKEKARLAFITERLRKLKPRFTDKDFADLELIMASVERMPPKFK